MYCLCGLSCCNQIVNEVPRSFNLQNNSRPAWWNDILTTKAVFERWPRETLVNPKARVLFQVQRLRHAVAQSNGSLSLIETQDDLRSAINAIPPVVSAILAVEGLTSLENDITNVDRFYNNGIRILYVAIFKQAISFYTLSPPIHRFLQTDFEIRNDDDTMFPRQRSDSLSRHRGEFPSKRPICKTCHPV